MKTGNEISIRVQIEGTSNFDFFSVLFFSNFFISLIGIYQGRLMS